MTVCLLVSIYHKLLNNSIMKSCKSAIKSKQVWMKLNPFYIRLKSDFIRDRGFIPSQTDLTKKDLSYDKSFFMGRGGFEPPKRDAADLQSVPFGHSGTSTYKLVMGLEPATC